MKLILKKLLLLWLVLFSTLLYADTDNKINIADAPNVIEGDAGDSNKEMVFEVTLTQKSWIFSVGVDYQIYNGSATAGEDFVTSSGTLSFAPIWSGGGEDTKEIRVPIIGDDVYEGDENLYIVLTNPTNDYIIDDDRGYGTIVDNEIEPLTLTLHNRAEAERDSNWILNFTARLNRPAPVGGVTLSYTTSDGSAKAGDDYIETNGTITIAEGVVDGYIPVEIIGDKINESTEQFHLDITSITGATLNDGNALGTIYDDDPIEFRISDERVTEGASGTTQEMTFTVYLLKEAPFDGITIDYYTQNGSATAGLDYTAISGTITFNSGEREKTITVTILGDDEIEGDEYFGVRLNNNSDGTIRDSYGNGRIDDDDGSFSTIEFDHLEFSIVEGNSSQQDLNFTFTITPASPVDATFDYGTWSQLNSGDEHIAENENGDNDYISTSGTKNILAGSTSVTIPVKINGDTKIEKDEEFYFYIHNQDKINISGGGAVAKGKIVNDDGSYPTLSCMSDIVSIEEGDSGQKTLEYLFTLDAPAHAGTSFEYKTIDESTDGSDYESIPITSYTIAEGERNISLSVQINGDTDIEPNERFYMELSNLINLDSSSCSRVESNIINDDGELPIVSIEAPVTTFDEGNSSTTRVDFSFKLDRPAHKDGLELKFKTKDGTATSNDDDYQEILPTTITFNTGETEKNASVYINGDELIEIDENFYIKMYDLVDLDSATDSLKIIIVNDDEHNEEPFEYEEPFECTPNMYLSSSIKRGTLETGRMWLHQIDTSKNPFEFKVVDDNGSDKLYNAIGFSEKDNYIYGLYYRNLIKLSKTSKVIEMVEIVGLPDDFNSTQLFAGAVYNNEFFVTGPSGGAFDKIFKIDLTDKNVTTITLSTPVSILDFSFSPDGKYLYGVANGGKLTKIDASDGTVTFIGEAHDGYQFDSSFSDTHGRFFANDSNGGGFFEFDLTTGEKSYISSSQRADYNDGANCINASLVFTDYGDAPLSYGKPRHDIKNGIFMGDEVDHDIDAYHSVNADGDDTNDRDDEDGVTLTDGSDINGTYFETNSTQELKIRVSKDGFLNAWINYNVDDEEGDFEDVGEQIFTAKALVAGENSISFFVPTTATIGDSYIRFRFSSTPSLNATENASDGEVEDYAIKFGTATPPLRGLFNIERVGNGAYPINSDIRNAWYTQTVGRDFDYSIIFYEEDWSSERVVDNVTIKLELINQYDNNRVIYQRYAHIKNTIPTSRNNISIPADDLAHLPATKDAIFKISYGVDSDGAVIQADCSEDPRICYERLATIRTDSAQDNFAIRPETFHFSIEDNLTHLKDSRNIDKSPLRLASGYDYTLNVTATQYRVDNTLVASPEYNTSVTRWLKFKSTGSCANSEDNSTIEAFENGLNTTKLMEFGNVGLYTLELKDENWTLVDQNLLNPNLAGCIMGSGERIPDANGKVGCSIKAYTSDMNLSFYPHHFNVNLSMNNLPDSGHSDFIYMSELNATYSGVAIQFDGDVTSKNRNNKTTTNFTAGCVSTNFNLDLNATTISVEGTNQNIVTIEGTPVNFIRLIRFNDDMNIANLDINRSLNRVDTPFQITADKFLDENNGTSYLDIRYNLNKNLTEPINPVEVIFHSIEINSTEADSMAYGVDAYIPKGSELFVNNRKNFYFARVVSDLQNYPRVNLNISPLVRTPLNVDMFCDMNITYCTDRNILANTNLTATTREQNGWYLSSEHNGELDGNVTKLDDNPNIVNTTPDPNSDIPLPHGENGMVIEQFINCSSPQSTITITTDPVLSFEPSQYIVNCTDNNASQWTGIGKTGNVLEVKPKVNTSGKMEW